MGYDKHAYAKLSEMQDSRISATLNEDGTFSEGDEALYQKLEAGRAIDPGEIAGEIRMGGSAQDTGTRAGDQLEMFQGGRGTRPPGRQTEERGQTPELPSVLRPAVTPLEHGYRPG